MNIRQLLCITFILTLAVFQGRAQEGEKETMIQIESSHGTIVLKLYNETPGHRDNMVKLVKEGFYKDQLFHRVIKDFMIQGGDPHSVDAQKGQRLGTGGPGYTVPAEFNPALIHKKGVLAAAREGDQRNPTRASSGSQFYIVQGRTFTPEMLKELEKNRPYPFTEEAMEAYTTLGGTPHLDGAYTVFGEVVLGLEVLDQIAAVSTDAYDRPVEDVIYSITLLE